MKLFKHQLEGIEFLREREGAGLFWEMGVGKTRTALEAARSFFDARGKRRIYRVLVICPASVRYAWREELRKLAGESSSFSVNVVEYKDESFVCTEVLGSLNGNPLSHMPVAIISYGMLQKDHHVSNIQKWCAAEPTVLIADESSYLKNRTAKQAKGAKQVGEACVFRWLLSGTPVPNSPLDLWAQAEVMYPLDRGRGPLHGFSNWFAFRGTFAQMQVRRMGRAIFSEVVGYKNLDKLQKRFGPFVSRVEKKDCLDLPPKIYTTREVALSKETWKLYQELKHDCLITLGDGEQKPEPNAAVRILRLAQITSGHYTTISTVVEPECNDISSEKLSWLVEEIEEGEFSNCKSIIVWCRWRRERERMLKMLLDLPYSGYIGQVYGGQSQKQRDANIREFQASDTRSVLLAQPHAGGFGLNLTVASTAIYLSNDYSWAVRAQSEDRIHRTGQANKCLYIDVLATGPTGQRTIDHVILEALKEKKDLATWTCEAWRKALQ